MSARVKGVLIKSLHLWYSDVNDKIKNKLAKCASQFSNRRFDVRAIYLKFNHKPFAKETTDVETVLIRWFCNAETMLVWTKSICTRSSTDDWWRTKFLSGLVKAAAVRRATDVTSQTLFLWQNSQMPKIAKICFVNMRKQLFWPSELDLAKETPVP